MEILKQLIEGATSLVPMVVAIAGTVFVILAIRFVIEKRYAGAPGSRFRIQMFTMILSLAGLLVIVITLPVSDSLRGQLLSLIGILLSAAIALSSTTFIGNIMAGLMLRVVRNFHPGDFIQVGDYFGRVSEQSLFHVEIQTENRDLTTMPNLYVATHPVKVIRSSGTIITAEVSLGYDVPRNKIEKALIEAAAEVPLEDPFVLVLELGDFSVTYRIGGLLCEVKQILSTRSRLRELSLDKLHQAGIEIVSPTFMNTRAIQPGQTIIPEMVAPVVAEPEPTDKPVPEKVVFDKADQAESLEKLKEKYERLSTEISELKANHGKTDDPATRAGMTEELNRLEQTRTALAKIIARREEEHEQDN